MDGAERIAAVCMFVFAGAGAACDTKTGKLPNRLTVPVFLAGLLFWAVAGFYMGRLWGLIEKLGFSLGGFALGFGILFGMWLIGGGSGGGDVKFIGALGSWIGAWLTIQVLVLGSVMSLLYTLARDQLSARAGGRGENGGRRVPTGRQPGSGAGRPRPGKRGAEAGGAPWYLARARFAAFAALATWTLLGLKWAGWFDVPWPPL